jgi:hypothetical protein
MKLEFYYFHKCIRMLKNYLLIFLIKWNGGLGIGDWGLGIGPNPQSPIPNPQSPIKNFINFLNLKFSQSKIFDR